ncbi:leucine-rich repeat protein [Ruminococcaceae bacterium OttesenSCG-928-L11]|nr:leucine-rich repeat protein [Ruminococcaceae bacterium OttesenSCG-928-L11]
MKRATKQILCGAISLLLIFSALSGDLTSYASNGESGDPELIDEAEIPVEDAESGLETEGQSETGEEESDDPADVEDVELPVEVLVPAATPSSAIGVLRAPTRSMALTIVDLQAGGLGNRVEAESSGAPGSVSTLIITGNMNAADLDYMKTSMPGLTGLDMSGATYAGTSLPDNQFEDCNFTSVDLPQGITSVGGSVFYGCEYLEYMGFPDSLAAVGSATFGECASLTSVDLSNCSGLLTLGDYAFGGCTSLANLSLPTSLTSLGEGPFSGCMSITSLDLSNQTQMTKINGSAFLALTGATEILLPDTIVEIGERAFFGCDSLQSLAIPAGVIVTISNSDALPDGVTVKVPAALLTDYKEDSQWAAYNVTFEALSDTGSETPTITTQPQGATITVGGSHTATIVASVNDGGELSYKLYREGTMVDDRTDGVFLIDELAIGTYTFFIRVVNDKNGDQASIDSNTFTVTVLDPTNAQTPVITTQPDGGVVTVGSTYTMNVTATVSDSGTLSYQWYKGGTPISGATSTSYSTPTDLPIGSHSYAVVVTNTNNAATGSKTAATTSATATVTVNNLVNAAAPVITFQPQGGTIATGGIYSMTVTATASDGGTLSYQWYKEGTAIPGATSAGYMTPSNLAVGNHSYHVVVTNTNNTATGNKTATTTSATATVTVNNLVNAAAPVITSQPQGGTITVGSTHALSVTATVSDGGTISYQWFKDGTAIPGANSANYTTPSSLTVGSHSYHVVVTNTNNAATGNKTATTTSTVVNVIVQSVPVGTTYSVTYHANGGSGTPPTQGDQEAGATFAAAYNTFTPPTGKRFKEWNTNSGGAGASYAENVAITMPGDNLDLYAIWDTVSPSIYQLSIHAAAGGSIINGNPGSYASGATISISAAANANYIFSGWTTSNGGSFGDQSSASTTFTMPANATAITANFTYIGGNSGNNGGGSSGGSSSGSGSSGSSGWVTGGSSGASSGSVVSSSGAAALEEWLEKAAATKAANEARNSSLHYIRTRSSDLFGVRGAAWSSLQGYQYQHDTVIGRAVQVRLYVPSPNIMQHDTMTSGFVSGKKVDRVVAIFEKWFANKIRVIHLDHIGSWGQVVQVAAKVDFGDMDTSALIFYSYNRAENTYTRIANPNYWFDANGYLRFSTNLAGDIVISEDPLERK